VASPLLLSGCATLNQGFIDSESVSETTEERPQLSAGQASDDASSASLATDTTEKEQADNQESEQTPQIESIYQYTSTEFVGPIYHDNLWDRVRSNLKLERDLTQPRVIAQLNWYKKHPT
jgi:membrane-bound lytic murein transglycosylase D